jgi:hypothetical protein
MSLNLVQNKLWPQCLLFGAMLSATDPVAVVAVLHEVRILWGLGCAKCWTQGCSARRHAMLCTALFLAGTCVDQDPTTCATHQYRKAVRDKHMCCACNLMLIRSWSKNTLHHRTEHFSVCSVCERFTNCADHKHMCLAPHPAVLVRSCRA